MDDMLRPGTSWIVLLIWSTRAFFIYLFPHGVGLSPLRAAAIIWPIVPAPDDRLWWLWSNQWNENWQRKPKYSERTCLSATLSITNPTWLDLGSNTGRRGGKPATNLLSYGTASWPNKAKRVQPSPLFRGIRNEVVKIIRHQRVGCEMNDEFLRILKEVVVA
jgi:hypothetical protein